MKLRHLVARPRHALTGKAHPWLLALLAICVGMGLPLLFLPVLGPRPYIFAFPAVILVALYAGVTPALLTAIGCVLWHLLALTGSATQGSVNFVASGLFLSLSFAFSILCGRFRSAARRQRGEASRTMDATMPRTALVRWLTASMYAAILLPLAFFIAATWYGHRQAFQEARIEVERANNMADQLLQNSLQSNLAMLQRMKVLVGNAADHELKPREKILHEHLVELSTGRRDTQAIWIWGADGRAVATNRFYPVPQDIVITDREYFRVQKDGRSGMYISDILFGRMSGEHFFNVSERRNNVDGSFGGIVSVSMYPSFFATTYETMARDMKDLTISLARADGRILARWPPLPADSKVATMTQDAIQATAGSAPTGIFSHVSNVDGARRLVSYRKIGDWPLYVYAGLSHQAILADWYRFVLMIAGFCLSTAIGLGYVSWVALRLARREHAAQAKLQHENSRRLQAEEALLQAQKLEALGQLTGGVAHDVNNLLMVIGTNTHVHRLLMPQVGRDNAQMAAIDRSVAAGAKLTRQLLSFSRRQTVAPEVILLQDRLSDLLDLVRSSLGSAIELELSVAADTRLVCLDLVDFELALINLALNAKDAMTHGKVRIEVANGLAGDIPTDPLRESVVVRFSDNGAGVAPENLARLFEPFFTTKPPGKGTGLGLSQVYGFCAQAGGIARIDSTLNVGTTVSMYFPVSTADAEKDKPVEPPALGTLSGNILLVEDNDDVGGSTTILLESLGMHVTRAATADAAYALLASKSAAHFDVVLSDIYMPGSLSGIDLALSLKSEFPQLPVVLMTGYAAEEHKAVEAGFTVLPKPFSPEVLVGKLKLTL